MGITINLKVTKGKNCGENYEFRTPCSVYVGRRSDCGIIFSETTISRYHCVLDIVPPAIKIRDFGSLNGTYVNNILIGKREKDQAIDEAQKNESIIIDLHNDDTLQLGNECEIQVKIHSDLICKKCGKTVGLKPNDFSLVDNKEIYCVQCKIQYDQEKREEQKRQLEQKAVKPEKKSEQNCLFPGYKTSRCLGRGGMGEVWLAEKVEDGKKYAIKRMLPSIAAVPHAREAFLREASLANQLAHDNIVTQYGFHQNNQEIFIVMEFCNGGSLGDHMRATGMLFSAEEALNCTIQILEGLHYAHTATVKTILPNGEVKSSTGIVHRDFKPSNIFIQKENGKTIYKVADFGLAKAFEIAGLSGHTKVGKVAGTPIFMPRQQVLDYMYSKPEVDVWAAAASLYFMLAGYPPKFNEKKDPWLVAVTESAVPIRKRNPNIPKKLANIIDTALIDVPSILFASAKEFQSELLKVYRELV